MTCEHRELGAQRQTADIFERFGTCFALIGLMAMATSPAWGRIQCQDNFQITQYGLIATPYCEEEQIARVAQAYGWKITAAEVHRDPLKKVYVCQVLGNDNRLKGSCAGYGPENYAPGR